MRIHVQRCEDMAVGAVSWLEGLDELLFVVSPVSVSAVGAATLAAVLQVWVDRGVWQWGPLRPGAQRMGSVSYQVGDLGEDVVDLTFRDGHLRAVLSREHFDASTAAGLARVAAEVAEVGWSWMPRVRSNAA